MQPAAACAARSPGSRTRHTRGRSARTASCWSQEGRRASCRCAAQRRSAQCRWRGAAREVSGAGGTPASDRCAAPSSRHPAPCIQLPSPRTRQRALIIRHPAPVRAPALQVFDANSRSVLRQLKGHARPVHITRFGGDRAHVLSGGDDAVVRWWDVAQGSQVRGSGRERGQEQSTYTPTPCRPAPGRLLTSRADLCCLSSGRWLAWTGTLTTCAVRHTIPPAPRHGAPEGEGRSGLA